MIIAGIWLVFSTRQSGNLQTQPISKLSTADFHSLAFSLTEPETIFFGHHHGLLVSHNGGKDWEPTTLNNADAMALALPPSDPQILYAAGHEVFFKSTDDGRSWESVSFFLAVAIIAPVTSLMIAFITMALSASCSTSVMMLQ